MKPNVLIVDDDRDFRASLELLVQREDYDTVAVGSLEAAREALRAQGFEVALVDLTLPDGDGMGLVEDRDLLAGTEIVVISGNADVDSAVAALRRGVLDFLTKPLDRSRLKSALASVRRTRALKAEVTSLRENLRSLGRFGLIVGRSKPMQTVFDLIQRVAPTEASVLITGESGTGKEVVARSIHELSDRKTAPLEAVNCGAIPASLIESELFGHEKGAFTGADQRRIGVFERASGGTLFLDEITEMSTELQVKLLRVLETGQVQRVGSSDVVDTDVRVIAASNRDPMEAIAKGKLREDLYYRLAVFPVELPPLRDRKGDVVLLAEHFLERLNELYETKKTWAPEALTELASRPWKGNVRELKNEVHRAFILAESVLTSSAAPSAGPSSSSAADSSAVQVKIGESIADAEKKLIEATLVATDGDKTEAARILGISLKTLYNRLKVYAASAPQQE